MTTPELPRRGKRSPLVWAVIGLSVSPGGFTALLVFILRQGSQTTGTTVSRDAIVAESNATEIEPAVAMTAKDFSASNVVSTTLGRGVGG